MKFARSLPAEPPLLLAYRTAHPNEEGRPANQATNAWETFKAYPAAYEELLHSLATAQQGLCIYCEQRVFESSAPVPLDYQVEHVRAKSGAVGRALDWTNLALACAGGTFRHHKDESRYKPGGNTTCGQRKEDADLPPGCDPRTFPLLDPLLEVGTGGKLTVHATNCASAGVAPKDVEDAITLLNLDCERIRMARQNVGDEVRRWFVGILKQLLTPQLTPTQTEQLVGLIVASRLQPDPNGMLNRFWSAERSAFGAPAETWLAANQGQFT